MTSQIKTDEYEIIPHARLKHMHSFINDIAYRNFHLHSDFEILLVLKGHGSIRIQEQIYELNELDSLIVNQNEIHEIEGDTRPFLLLMIQFSRHFCGDYFPVLRNTAFNTRLLRQVFTPEEYRSFVHTVMQFNYCYIKEEPMFELSCLDGLITILKALYSHASYTIINENQYQESKKKSERLNRISAYIASNYLSPIRLKDLADMEGITVTHMSHFFTKNFGVSFQEYLTSRRMEEAVRLSHSGHFSNVMISELSGFSDPKYLNKAFEAHFGCSYKEFIPENILPVQGKKKESRNVFERYLSFDECMKLHSEFAQQELQPGNG